jgi:hypothetical protein
VSRPFTRAQALENRAFLNVLRRTGNVRLAAREVGLKYGTVQHRRRTHPAFAVRWDAALACAQAGLAKKFKKEEGKGRRGALTPLSSAESPSPSKGEGLHPSTIRCAANGPPPHELGSQGGAYRTTGGEAVVVRLASGKLQVRRAQAGKLTPVA